MDTYSGVWSPQHTRAFEAVSGAQVPKESGTWGV